MNLSQMHPDLSYEEKWEHLKSTIVKMYLVDNATVRQIAQSMSGAFGPGINVQIHHYRHYLHKKWGIRKRAATTENQAEETALGKRRRQGPEVLPSQLQFEPGEPSGSVDENQLKRGRQILLPFRPGMFLEHKLPHIVRFGKLAGPLVNTTSPLTSGPQTSSDLALSSLQNQSSLQDASSPTAKLLHRKALNERSHLFLSGSEVELMQQMSPSERRVTANWLHDYWMFFFVTTKYWGKGPEVWTLSEINAKTLTLFASHPSGLPKLDVAQSPSLSDNDVVDPPTQLCSWSIHYQDDIAYEDIVEQSNRSAADDDGVQDIEDESTWKDWDRRDDRDLTATITQGLQANLFTKYQAEELPLDVTCITDAVSSSPDDATVEAIGFAIMTRNFDVLMDLMTFPTFNRQTLREISPFHLAAKYLDGSKTCCGLMNVLVQHLDDEMSIGAPKNYTDRFGMTVLDTLFTTILRSHTSITPQLLGDNFIASGSAFEEGDVDICGRWDADSPCVRHLHDMGKPAIPHEWKHMFCHTSVQAVCHCISAIFMGPWAPRINTVSGLFQRRCRSCGSTPKVSTLHTFVLACFHLANLGRPGETLFGMLACLVSLLTFGADPTSSAEISIPAILGREKANECQHQSLNAAELAAAVPKATVRSWTSEIQLGWKAIKGVLNHRVARMQMSTRNGRRGLSDFSSTSNDIAYDYGSYVESDYEADESDAYCSDEFHGQGVNLDEALALCGDSRLGMVWAAIQVELLTYRRVNAGDPWLSGMFNMRDVVKGMRAKDDSIVERLVEHFEKGGQNPIRPFSQCGVFSAASHPGCVRREEACHSYFANFDDWKRTTFIPARSVFEFSYREVL